MYHSITPALSVHQPRLELCPDNLPPLTSTSPLQDCRVCVIVPVRNEAGHLPAMIEAIAHQVNEQGQPINPNSYELLVLANNCSDDSAAIARSLSKTYPALQLHVLEVNLPPAQAHVGKARQMVMNEAYRRLSTIGLDRRIIASTDGDTEVSPTWISTLLKEFDKGVDAVGGRILTQRAAAVEINQDISLHYLRRLAHRYLTSQIEAFLDPQPHDCWPRHFQYYGANMSVLAEMYGRVGGLPCVREEEDVALYRQLQQADAKIRHSIDVRVVTSARRTGRATGGLAELLEELAQASRQHYRVESPQLTEARILVRRQLRQIWAALQGGGLHGLTIRTYGYNAKLLAKSLGLSEARLRQEIEAAPTFGLLVEAISAKQKQNSNYATSRAATEISFANMHLRQRLQVLRQHRTAGQTPLWAPQVILETLQQVQSIPIFSLTD